jgi:hypothetical protein
MRMLSVLTMCVSVLLLSAGGCEKKPAVKPEQSATDDHGHNHGPNDGEIIEFTEEDFHGELLRDIDKKVTTIFVLDKSAEKAAPIAAEAVIIRMVINATPTEFKLPAKPLAGEAAGNASRFESNDELLHLALDNKTADRELEIKHGDKTYSGKFEYYEPHGHGPDHEDEHKDKDHDHEKEAKDAQPKS